MLFMLSEAEASAKYHLADPSVTLRIEKERTLKLLHLLNIYKLNFLIGVEFNTHYRIFGNLAG